MEEHGDDPAEEMAAAVEFSKKIRFLSHSARFSAILGPSGFSIFPSFSAYTLSVESDIVEEDDYDEEDDSTANIDEEDDCDDEYNPTSDISSLGKV